MSNFLDELFRSQPTSALVTNTGALVDVSASDPPVAGYTLTAIDDNTALWLPPAAAVDSTARAAAAAAQSTANAAVPKVLYDANRTPAWDPPLTADSQDDEFTVDTLASGVWRMKTTAAPLVSADYTRNGDVDPTGGPPALKYNSTLVGSTLLVQPPLFAAVTLFKAVTLTAANQLWMFGVSAMGALVGGSHASANDPFWSGGIYKSASSLPDFNNRDQVHYRGSGSANGPITWEHLNVIAGVSTTDAMDMTKVQGAGGWQGMGIYWLNNGAGGSTAPCLFTPYGDQVWWTVRTWLGFATTAGFCVITLNAATGMPPGGAPIYALHFVRRKVVTPITIFG